VDDGLRRFGSLMREADVTMVGSYVPDGAKIADWIFANNTGVTVFYDIDTPVTLAALQHANACEYLTRAQVAEYDLYLSFAGGRAIERLADLGAVRPTPLYCSVDPQSHRSSVAGLAWEMGYLGTYAADRQPALDTLLLSVAKEHPKSRFVVGGPLYPTDIKWPSNVGRLDHVPPASHATFYLSQRYTLSLTRADMRALGHAPSVRLFEAAACGATIISDDWDGLEEFLVPDSEILLAATKSDVESYLHDLPDRQRIEIGKRAQKRVLAEHTASHRAAELESHVAAIMSPAASVEIERAKRPASALMGSRPS
jgi:spore maturation protein CgeB